MSINIIWFRHGLRLHDNPALLEAIADKNTDIELLPIFIFDGESAGTKSVGYNRLKFLLDSLKDINEQLQNLSLSLGRLYMLQGSPVQIFRRLHEICGINKLCFEQDCEPIWNRRDNAVKKLCHDLGITCLERISHTLWDPKEVIDTNGGIPPLTYQMFLHTVQIIGLPPRPVPDPDWRGVKFHKLNEKLIMELKVFLEFPTPEDFNVYPDNLSCLAKVKWIGGETQALLHLHQRLKVEENAFKCGYYLPNQAKPNILESPKSMSAHLRFGCLSVRKFYWDVHDLFKNVQLQAKGLGLHMSGGSHITGQLIWREYFYTMSVNNPNYDRMEGNEICLNIPWAQANHDQLKRWTMGQTGFPLIDAAMRQLLAEGWLHHTLRNTVATFLTRGGLWQNWEHGLRYFLKYLLDADWSVCAGNWMWVSSSAFESLLDSSLVTCPVALGKRLDPMGQYIKQYVPELSKVPKEYIFEEYQKNLGIEVNDSSIFDMRYDNLPEKCKTTRLPKSCNEATFCTQRSGIYKILFEKYSTEPFLVECDVKTDGGGWLLIQRRQDGSVDFYRNWFDYQKGFGNIEGEFFIGLDKLHALTNFNGPQELLIVLEDNNEFKYAKYNNFVIGNESEQYALKHLGFYSGDAGDSLALHLGMKFSTKDRDNDYSGDESNCSIIYTGAWWYKKCHVSNLNGKYGDTTYGKGITWLIFRGYNVSIKHVKMMIRRRRF